MLYETVAALLWNGEVVRALKREHSWWLVDRQCPVLTDFDWHSACGLQPLLLARAVLDKAICVGNHTIHGHWKKEVSVMLLSKEWLVLLGLLAMFLCKGNMQRNSGHKVFGSSLRARRVGNLKTWVICCKQKLKVEMQFAESVHTNIVILWCMHHWILDSCQLLTMILVRPRCTVMVLDMHWWFWFDHALLWC